MRIKDGRGKKIELIFLIIATTLTIFLLAYLIWLVQHLVEKADAVFSLGVKDSTAIPTYNFAKYEEIFKNSSTSVSGAKPANGTSTKQ